MNKIKWWCSLAVIIYTSCNEPVRQREVSFYHWKSTFNLTALEKQYLDELQVNKLFLHFFDVRWVPEQNAAFPDAVLEKNLAETETDIVPVIFITNEAMLKTDASDIPELAQKIGAKTERMLKQRNLKADELQLDCDWNLDSRERYFDLLRQLKAMHPEWELSATIRLHQVKYREMTGVPPVDKGVLMFYNMGSVSAASESNSILNLQTAAKYTARLSQYPLQLDIALPLFSWGVHFRNGQLIQLINGLNQNDLEADKAVKALDNNYYRICITLPERNLSL